jgi:xanthine dehydrogenase accessory factor
MHVSEGLQGLLEQLQQGPGVRVTLIGIKGSSPRGVGASMLVHDHGQSGSIGGGALEYAAQHTARELLAHRDPRVQFTQVHGLGPDHEQCCGGAVTLLFQRFQAQDHGTLRAALGTGRPLPWRLDGADTALPLMEAGNWDHPAIAAAMTATDGLPCVIETAGGRWWVESPAQAGMDLYLFGAGHVGTALVPLLADLPLRLHWFDSRQELLPDQPPAHVVATLSDDPIALVDSASDQALFLVMTHSHPLDEDICHAVLAKGRFGWLGLIGSKSKRARFAHRLARRGIAQGELARLQCPVGLAGVQGKRPATIALAIAAQLVAEQLPAALR